MRVRFDRSLELDGKKRKDLVDMIKRHDAPYVRAKRAQIPCEADQKSDCDRSGLQEGLSGGDPVAHEHGRSQLTFPSCSLRSQVH
jgi:hypothetical protein